MTGATVSADPDALEAFASLAPALADDLRRVARRACEAVERWNASIPAGRRASTGALDALRAVATGIEETDRHAGRVADAMRAADETGMSVNSLLTPRDWPATTWAEDVLVHALASGTTTPGELAAWPERVLLEVGQHASLTTGQRDAANRAAIRQMLLRDEVLDGELFDEAGRRALIDLLNLKDVPDPAGGSALPVHVLTVRPPGLYGEDPELVFVVGELATSEAVAQWMPGTTHGVHTAMQEVDTATTLLGAVAEVSAGAPVRTAVVVDLYDAPDTLLGAASPTFGNHHAQDARRSVADVARLAPDARITVIGHSYGSFAAGRAAAGPGVDANALVLLATPGVGEDHALDVMPLRAGPDKVCNAADGVFVARAPKDPIVVPADVDEGLNWIASRPFPAVKPLLDELPIQPGAELSLGTDPADASFGAIPIEVNDVETLPGSPGWSEGHSAYLDPDTRILWNVAAIVAGLAPSIPAHFAVDARERHFDTRAPDFLDDLWIDTTRGPLLGTDGARP